MSILGAITVFVGYFPSYYQKPLESLLPLAPSPILANIIHIHAAVMSTYILFYVMQTALVSINRRDLGTRTSAMPFVQSPQSTGSGPGGTLGPLLSMRYTWTRKGL